MNELNLILKLLFFSSFILCISFYFMHECYSEMMNKNKRDNRLKNYYYKKFVLYRNLIFVNFSIAILSLILLNLINL